MAKLYFKMMRMPNDTFILMFWAFSQIYSANAKAGGSLGKYKSQHAKLLPAPTSTSTLWRKRQ
jgi:hypothetical protein